MAPSCSAANDCPIPENLNPQPETRNPKPETRNPKPETRNPKPQTATVVDIAPSCSPSNDCQTKTEKTREFHPYVMMCVLSSWRGRRRRWWISHPLAPRQTTARTPKTSTLNPQLSTRNPKPETRNPEPQTATVVDLTPSCSPSNDCQTKTTDGNFLYTPGPGGGSILRFFFFITLDILYIIYIIYIIHMYIYIYVYI
ncbi:hypothetical protein T484DRAFT_1641719 [Baffinella frigidus]|nr:hypothetical protein T484DRAFT_1641719 [Cryptophyta sp. CCMP2293]